MKKIVLLCLLAFSLASLLSLELYDEEGRPQCYTDRVIVKLADIDDVTRSAEDISVSSAVKGVFEQVGVTSVNRLAKTYKIQKRNLDRFLLLNIDTRTSLEETLNILNSSAKIEYAEAMPIFYPDDVPNDESYSSLHHLQRIQAEEAWDIHKGEDGSEEIIVAIVDSGIAWQHPDLVDNVWNNLGEDLDNDGHTIEFIDGVWQFDPDDINGIDDDNNGFADDFVGWNFVNADGEQSNDLDDPSNHGTHCSGLAAGVTNNTTGIASISWNVTLMGTGHDADGGNAYESNCFDGIIYALDNGADVISCSWGTGMFSRSYEEIINDLLGETVILASAGNSNWARPHYPSGYANIISVASTASTDAKAYYSCFGIATDISSPGGDTNVDGGLLSTVTGGYASYQGTSMASPFAAGLTSLIRSQHPEWTRERVIQQLLATCDNIDEQNPNYINELGSGRINALRALTEVNPTIDPRLRLSLVRADNNALVANGNSVDVSIRIKNYASLTSSDNLTLELSTDAEGINITNGSWTGSVPADWTLDLEDVFSFDVTTTTVDSIHFVITSSADIEITHGQEMDFFLPVQNNNKVLIWEHDFNGNDMSAILLRNFCQENNIAYDYYSEDDFPASFLGYKALFMSWGQPAPYPYYDEHPNIDDYLCPRIVDYLNAGGRVYMEGNSVMYNQSGQIWVNIDNNTAEMFGVTVDDGDFYNGYGLIGQEGSIAEGLEFNQISQVNVNSIDRYSVINGAQPLLIGDEYGLVAVQNETDNYKTICSAFSLNSMANNGGAREQYLSRMFEFFEIPFLAAEFTSDNYSGHNPTSITFENLSTGFPNEFEIEWDFDNNGTIDSSELNPSYTYSDVGEYDVRMIVTNGQETKEIIKENYIRVFDGFSSLEIDEATEAINIGSSYDLTQDYTIELWFRPNDWGEIAGAGFGQIFSWGITGAMLVDNFTDFSHTLSFWAYTTDGVVRVYCPSNAITLHEWHHIAIVYSQQNGLKILLNGVEQTLNTSVDAPLQSGDYDLIFGNNSSNNRTVRGNFDQIRIYNTALASDDIAGQMNESTAGITSNQLAYFHFNEGYGTTFQNETTGEDIELSNGVEWDFAAPFETTPNSNTDDVQAVDFMLSNYPNPFKQTGEYRSLGTTISFTLKEAGKVTIDIYNLKGQHVKSLVNDSYQAGCHKATWNGRDSKGNKVASGLFFYRMKSGKYSSTKKMILLK
jgi:subtilisin family serine protease/PKD repeat protein